MVATFAATPALTAVNDAIFPEPLAARPMEASLFVQLKDVAVPVKLTAVTVPP